MKSRKIIALILSFAVVGGLFGFSPMQCSAKSTPKKVTAKKAVKKPVAKKVVAKKPVAKKTTPVKKPTTPAKKPTSTTVPVKVLPYKTLPAVPKVPTVAEVYANRSKYLPDGKDTIAYDNKPMFQLADGLNEVSMTEESSSKINYWATISSDGIDKPIVDFEYTKLMVTAIKSIYGDKVSKEYEAYISKAISICNADIKNGSVIPETNKQLQIVNVGNIQLTEYFFIHKDIGIGDRKTGKPVDCFNIYFQFNVWYRS